MTRLKPFLTNFARPPDRSAVSGHDTDENMKRELRVDATMAAPPRPTGVTRVDSETTDES